jgi:hypothetical protein
MSYCLLHFYKYEESELCANAALESGNLNLKLTGKLGKRTIWQENNYA